MPVCPGGAGRGWHARTPACPYAAPVEPTHPTTEATASRLPWQARLPFFYGWIIVGHGLLFSFFGIGVTWAASILAIPMQDDLAWSRSDIFFAVSVRGWMAIFIAPIIGRYLDMENGARLLAIGGGLLNAASLLLIGQVQAVWQFVLLFGILGGIAQTAQSGVTVAIVPKWFIAKRGTAVAYSTLGGAISAFAMPALLAPLSDGVGWRMSWVVVAGLAFIFACLPALLLRREPEDVGLLPDGERSAQAPVAASSATPVRRAEEGSTLRQALSERTFWLLLIGISLGSLTNNGVPAIFTTMFVERGFTLEAASSALVAYGVASMSAKFAWGWLTNRLHVRPALVALTLFGVFAMPSILFLPEGLGSITLIYGFLVGFFVGAFIPLHQLVWSVYYGRAHVGAISGVARPAGLFFAASGPFLMAASRDLTGAYDAGILLTTACVAACAVCIYLARPSRPTGGLVVASSSTNT
ncbi:MAG: MFS transporter [Dehalococcoidia bacterium]|nr:MFS transporter [Dehalococcoidia bacterium]